MISKPLYFFTFVKKVCFLFSLSVVCSFPCLANEALDSEHKLTFSVGVVPQFETSKLHDIWNPILDYLSNETGHQFKLEGTNSIPNFEKELLLGQYDFAYMNPYQFVLSNQEQGYLPLIRDVGRELYGVLVIKKSSGIKEVRQLHNQKLAFPAPNALGASLLIRQELQDNFNIDIQPIYVNNHDSVYLNVLLGKTAAGGGVQKTFNRQKPKYIEALNIIHQTQKVSPHPFAAHERIPKYIITKVVNAFITLGESDAGLNMLKKIPITKIGNAKVTDYKSLNNLGLERFYDSSK